MTGEDVLLREQLAEALVKHLGVLVAHDNGASLAASIAPLIEAREAELRELVDILTEDIDDRMRGARALSESNAALSEQVAAQAAVIEAARSRMQEPMHPYGDTDCP